MEKILTSMIDSKIQALSKTTNRSFRQTEFLLELCDKDFKKLLCLEQKIKENFLPSCPDDKEGVSKILNIPPKEFPWKDIMKEYMLNLLAINKSEYRTSAIEGIIE